jgi:LysM repeat protein
MVIIRRSLAAALACVLLLVGAGCRTGGVVRTVPSDVLTHTVAVGDTLSKISRAYCIGVDEIILANNLDRIELQPGRVLRLPGGRKPIAKPALPVEQPVAKPTASVDGCPDYAAPRSTWAIQAIDAGNIDPMGGTPWRITVHHSGDASDARDEVVTALRRIEQQHKLGAGKNEPFACIGYHFIISSDGRIWEGRPLQYQGAHATGDNNKGNIGICLLGNFDTQNVPVAQRDRLYWLLERLCADYGISASNIVGHNHFKTTDCPGRHLEPLVLGFAHGSR